MLPNFDRIFLIFAFIFAATVMMSCENKQGRTLVAKSSDTHAKTSEDRLISTLSDRPEVGSSKCEEAIVQSLCVTSLSKNDIDPDCRPDEVNEKQKQVILEIYRELPKILQKPFCQIHRIQLHPQMEQIAYSALIRPSDSTKKPVYMIGIQAVALDSAESKIDFISGKELKAFFVKPQDFQSSKAVRPYVFIDSKIMHYQSLYIFAHELSHLIDYQQNITALTDQDCKPQPQASDLRLCQYAPGRFGHISWRGESYLIRIQPNQKITIAESESATHVGEKPFWSRTFPTLAEICFYNCTASKNTSAMQLSYEELSRSSFATLYGSTAPAEDFAETLSLVLLSKNGKLETFQILKMTAELSPSTLYIDIFKHLGSPAMTEKMEWLNRWLETQ